MAWFRTRVSAAAGLSFILAVTAGCGSSATAPKSGGAGGSSESNDKGPAEIGKGAPDLSIQTVNGKGQITRDSLSGKVAIVDFWATWCGPCKQSFPKLEELAKQNQGKVQVVGISVDDKADGVASKTDAAHSELPAARARSRAWLANGGSGCATSSASHAPGATSEPTSSRASARPAIASSASSPSPERA
jgi:thiol-disulfide isomerase/thioredoxin